MRDPSVRATSSTTAGAVAANMSGRGILKGALSWFTTLSVYINSERFHCPVGIERGIIPNNAPFKGTDFNHAEPQPRLTVDPNSAGRRRGRRQAGMRGVATRRYHRPGDAHAGHRRH